MSELYSTNLEGKEWDFTTIMEANKGLNCIVNVKELFKERGYNRLIWDLPSCDGQFTWRIKII